MSSIPPSLHDAPDRDPGQMQSDSEPKQPENALTAPANGASISAIIQAARQATSSGSDDLSTYFGSLTSLSDVKPGDARQVVTLLKELGGVLRDGSIEQASVEALRSPEVRGLRVRRAALIEQLTALGIDTDGLDEKKVSDLAAELAKTISDAGDKEKALAEALQKAREEEVSAIGEAGELELSFQRDEALRNARRERIGRDGAHIAELDRESAQLYRDYVREELPEAQKDQLADEKKRLERKVAAIGHVTGWMIPSLSVGSAAASGWFTYIAFDKMSATLAVGDDSLNMMALLGAGLLNGSLLTFSLLVQKGVVSIHPFPKNINAGGSVKRKFNLAALAMVAAHTVGSGISATSNVGGAAAEQATDLVVSAAWAERDQAAREFVETAEEGVEPNLDAVSELVQLVDERGTRLVLESTGQWSESGPARYGYRTRSAGEMEGFRSQYSDTAIRIAGTYGDCGGLTDLQAVGYKTIDALEAENRSNPSFAPGVREFSRSPFDLSTQIARCQEFNPDRIAQLSVVETRLAEIQEQINNGEIQGTYELNIVIRELNPILLDVAHNVNMEPVQLDELDPIAQEGALLSFQNAHRAIQQLRGIDDGQRVSWVLLVLTILMMMVDQVGMGGAMITKFAESRLIDGYEQYRRRLNAPLDNPEFQ